MTYLPGSDEYQPVDEVVKGTPTADISGTELRNRLRTGAVSLAHWLVYAGRLLITRLSPIGSLTTVSSRFYEILTLLDPSRVSQLSLPVYPTLVKTPSPEHSKSLYNNTVVDPSPFSSVISYTLTTPTLPRLTNTPPSLPRLNLSISLESDSSLPSSQKRVQQSLPLLSLPSLRPERNSKTQSPDLVETTSWYTSLLR